MNTYAVAHVGPYECTYACIARQIERSCGIQSESGEKGGEEGARKKTTKINENSISRGRARMLWRKKRVFAYCVAARREASAKETGCERGGGAERRDLLN